MRSRVQPFPVKVQDSNANARSSVGSIPRSRAAMPWLTTLAAMALGGFVGWFITLDEGDTPARQSASSVGQAVAPHAVAEALSAVRDGVGQVRRAVDGRPAVPTHHWPIVLNRAGDGRFYADLTLDGHIVTILIDPTASRSLLSASMLPPSAVAENNVWLATDIVLEHFRLPQTAFRVSRDPDVESVLGADLLRRHFTVDETFDRLRLAPVARS
jgi:hypothetical protein